MLPATMKSLRGIHPKNATAAILKDYRLAFDIRGNPLVEPSAASARPSKGDLMHGVLYELSDQDFARVGFTEGVPFGYRWQRCEVYPYVGDGESAGAHALETNEPLPAYTLVAARPSIRDDIPTSRSYLRILQEGAAYWKMDRLYQVELSKISIAKNLIPPDGTAGSLLCFAELVNPSR